VNEIYNTWKVLRNYLGKFDPKDSLQVLRYYSLYDGTLKSLPPSPPDYIEVHSSVYRLNNGILPWDMEVLAREIIYRNDEHNSSQYTLREWPRFARALNLLKDLENTISRVGIDQERILSELFRIGHRQFPYQLDGLSSASIVRYHRLFGYEGMADIVVSRVGIDINKILTIGLCLSGMYGTYATVEHPKEDWVQFGITKEDVGVFLNTFSLSFDEIKSQISTHHSVDNTFFYQFNPLSAHPLVRFGEGLEAVYVCVSVPRFEMQYTRGLYYSLYQDPRFDNAFGTAFQEYIGDMMNETFNESSEIHVYGEETDTTPGKKRCDWVIDQANGFTIIECKTKRMAMPGYTQIDDDNALISELSKLAEAVVQSYESYLVYAGVGYNPGVYPFSAEKDASICVVTLEKWYLFGPTLSKLRVLVKEQLVAKGIDSDILTSVPFCVVGADEFEKICYLLTQNIELKDLITPHNDPSHDISTWEFSSYVNEEYKEALQGYSYVFHNEMDDAYTDEAKLAILAHQQNAA
jgi:hypothetical protein